MLPFRFLHAKSEGKRSLSEGTGFFHRHRRPPPLRFPSMAGSLPPAAPLPIHRLEEPLLRRLSGSLDRAAPGRGWRDLAQLAGSHRGVKLR